MNEPSLKECFANTDLEWRLGEIPDSAACRGVYFNMLDERAGDFGPLVQRAYRDYFKAYKFSPLRLFSVKDYLTRMAVLAQINFGGEGVYRGIFQLQAASWPAWRKTLMGRATLGILGTEFHAILKMVRSTVRMSINYGSFDLEGGPTQYRTHHRNEYNYIEHAMAGGIAGIARVCNVQVEITPQLVDAFNGTLIVNVSPLRDAVAGTA
jgi:uncharacterized protein (TIGR02265 family)